MVAVVVFIGNVRFIIDFMKDFVDECMMSVVVVGG